MKAPLRSLAVLILGAAASAAPLRAATLTWSGTAPAASGTVGGAGTWNTSSLNWWDGSSAAAWNNANLDTAAFAGTSGAVTLNTNITAGGLWFGGTSGYNLNLGANTLTLGAATNTISLNTLSTLTGTITGLVTGTGNVRFDGGSSKGANSAGRGTLNLIGTATTGWSGITTITDGVRLTLSQTNQALRSTSAINLVNGSITLSNANNATEAQLDRISNTAPITVTNGGGLNYTTVNSGAFAETTGTVSLASGQMTIQLTANQTTGTQALTLSGLTRSSNTASIIFSPSAASTSLDATRNRIVVSDAAGATPAGQIIGAWAMAGTGTAFNYAVYDANKNVLAATIAASNENVWTSSSNAYTANTAQTLNGTRTITALRLTSTAATINVGSGSNLETYGLMATAASGTTLISAAGAGVVTTPSGGGNLFLSQASSGTLQIAAPITNNGADAVTLVKNGAGSVYLSGSNTFSGNIVMQAGTLLFSGTEGSGALGAAGTITFAGDSTLRLDNTAAGTVIGNNRTIEINDGVTATIYGTTRTIAATITGSGALRSDGGSSSNLTYTGDVNVTGPVWITQQNGWSSFTNLIDTAGVGPVMIGLNGAVNGADFRWAGGTQTFTNRQFMVQSTAKAGLANYGSGALTISRDLGFGGTQTGTIPFTLGGTSTGFSNEFAGRIANSPTGTVSLTKADAGTWILSGSNTYTGTTTLTAGELAISSDANISGTASPLLFQGGTLEILGTSLTSLNPNRPTTFSGTSATHAITIGFNIDDAANTFTVSQNVAMVTGTGSLTKTGAGTLLLSGSNTYTGVTNVNAGALRLRGGSAIADAATLAMGGGSVLLDTSETVGQFNVTAAGTLTSGSGATLTSTGGVAVSAANSTLDLGLLVGSGGAFAVSGSSNTITLSGSNAFASGSISGTNTTLILANDHALGIGAVTFSAGGTLQAGGGSRTLANSIVLGNNLTVSGSNGLGFTGLTNSGGNRTLTNSLTAGSLAFSGTTFLQEGGTGAGRTMTLAGTGNTTFSGPIVNGGTAGNSALTITNSGTTTLSGINTYTGVTNVNAGTLRLQGGSAIVDSGTLAMGGGSVLLDTSETIGRLNVTAAGTLSSGSGVTLTSTGGVVVSASNSVINVHAPLAGGLFNITGQGNTITLGASNTFTSGSITSAINNTLILGNAAALGSGSFAVGNPGSSFTALTLRAAAPLTIDTTLLMAGKFVTFTVDGTNSLTFNNYGSWGVDGAETSAQGVTLYNNLTAGGVLTFPTLVTDPAATGSIRSFTLEGSGNTNIGNLIVGSVGSSNLIVNNSGTTTISGTVAATGSLQVNNGRLIIGENGVFSPGKTQAISASGASVFEYASSLTGTLGNVSGPIRLEKTGAGTLTLANPSSNSYTGGLALSGGRLNINTATALGGAGSTFTITSGTFDNSTAGAITVSNTIAQAWNGNFEFLGTSALNLGAGAVTLGTNPTVTVTSSTLTIGGVIGDGGFGRGFTKEGAGVLRLTGTNTFSGTTRINAGTLELNGTSNNRVLQNSIVDLGGAGTLANYGTTPVFGGLINYSGFTLSGSVTRLTFNVAVGTTQTYATLPGGGASTIGFGKEGAGTLVFDGTFNYTGETNVDDGVLEVASLSNAGQPGPLGSGTTINLGAGATSGTFRYVGATAGSTNRTFNLAGTTGGGGIDASGVGALTVSSTVTGGNGVRSFTLTGTSTALNTIGLITGTGVSVTKSGPGTWRLGGASDASFGGQFTLQEGTVRVGVTSVNVLGQSSSAPIIGSGSSGTAALLLESGVTLTRTLTVPAGSGQAVLIGGVSGTTTYGGGKNLQLGRAVTLVAPTGGRVDFNNGWVNVDDTGTPAANVTIGTADYTGRAVLQYGGTLATTGTVAVEYGTAVLGLDTRVTSAGTLTTAAGATLAGTGIVTNAIGGAGLVSPGNSPGILTAGSLDPSAGTDFIFEITGTAPDFAAFRDASVNDVLRLTDATSPFASNLGAGNVVNVLFNLSSGTAPVAAGTYTGAFFTDRNVDFFSSISSGSFAYWVLGAYGSGGSQQQFAVGPEGSLVTYSRLAAFDASLSVQKSVVPQTGTVTGQITQFVVVPEPATIALAGIGAALAGWRVVRWRRRR